MQGVVDFALILRQISLGVFLFGLFYTFGMFVLGRFFEILSDAGEQDIDADTDVGDGLDYDGSVEADVESDISLEHDIEGEVEHDIEAPAEHTIEHDTDTSTEADQEIGYDIDHDIGDAAGSGFFMIHGGAPMGVTISTGLIFYGLFGLIIYSEDLLLPLVLKFVIQLVAVAAVVYSIRAVLSRVFVEAGFMILPRHLVGSEVEAVSTVRDDFGEIRAKTEMGLRRFNARPFQRGQVYQKGTRLFVVSADEKFVYVDPNKDLVTWFQRQSRREPKDRK